MCHPDFNRRDFNAESHKGLNAEGHKDLNAESHKGLNAESRKGLTQRATEVNAKKRNAILSLRFSATTSAPLCV